MIRITSRLLVSFLAIILIACGDKANDTPESAATVRSENRHGVEVEANDHRVIAGVIVDDERVVSLTAQKTSWRPQEEMAPAVTVYAFGEGSNPPLIPGPFLRMRAGETLTLKITNNVPPGELIGLPPPNRRYENIPTQTGETLVIRGLETAFGAGPIEIPYGQSREVRLKAVAPGEYFYWGSTTGRPLRSRTGPESQLTGLIVIDSAEGPIDPDERFFVITMIDSFPEMEEDAAFGDMFEPAINGRSWPKTERLNYSLGQEVRWRWINGSGFEHPMHLHGFHFRVLEWSDGVTRMARDPKQEIVTELMLPGTTFSMVWTPTREGAWLVHCHMKDHVAGVIDDAGHYGDAHHSDADHALRAMDGLVMGITIKEEGEAELDPPQARHLKLVAMERPSAIKGASQQGYALFEGADMVSDFSAPGPPIFLNKGIATRITVENRLGEPTAVHWHGLELQSQYDGVPGWSRTRDNVAPLLRTGDTFDVVLSPPKAGTFMYHTHMDATRQLNNGMFGPLIVTDTNERFDPEREKIFLLGDSIDGRYQGVTINGRETPDAMTLQAGTDYRFRFINITEGAMLHVALMRDGQKLHWAPAVKDGADLPPNLREPAEASFLFNAGETYDFVFSPMEPMVAQIAINWEFATFVGGKALRHPIIVE